MNKLRFGSMMKKYLIAGLSIAVLSCGAPDKQKQLEELKAKQDKITQQIKEIENELSGTESYIPPDNSPQVVVSEIQPSEFKHFVEVQGRIDAEENTQVNAQTPGIVKAIYVKEGSNVSKGQVMADLDTQVLKKSMEEVQTQLDLANNLYEKQKNLWDKKIGTEVQYLTARSNKESLEQRLASMQEQIDLAKYVSPITGTVDNIPFKVGQMVSPGVPGTAIRVINLAKIKAVAEVSEAYAAVINMGNEVLINFPDYGKDIETKISFTSRYIDPTNRTFTVEARLDPSKIAYRANMIAKLRINDYTNPNALVVPVNLVQNSLNGHFVYVAEQKGEKNIAVRKTVKPGIAYNGMEEINEGLQPGDKIITTGYIDLKEGETVNF